MRMASLKLPQLPLILPGMGAIALWLVVWHQDWLLQLLSLGAVLGAGGFWLTRGRNLTLQPVAPTSTTLAPTPAAVQQALAQVQTTLTQWQTEAGVAPASPSPLEDKLAQVSAALDRQELRIGIVGGQGVGKTTLQQLLSAQEWPPHAPVCEFVETPGRLTAAAPAPDLEQSWDLLLFLVQGDLTQPEYVDIQSALTQQQRLLLVLNKQDQYLPTQQQLIRQKLTDHLQGLVSPEDILAIATQPRPVKVRRQQADGSWQEWSEQPSPQLEPLVARLNQVIQQEASQLIAQQALRQARILQAEAEAILNQTRRDRTLPLIERYQWIAAGAAFANPFPTLDVLATVAISGQLVLEISKIYQQKLTLAQAQAIAGILAQLLLKFGMVEFATQTLGNLLKGHSLTYIAGGCVQGASAAYLTRLAGLSLIEHFQSCSFASQADVVTASQSALSEILPRVFQQHQRPAFLQGLVQQALQRLVPGVKPANVSPAP